MNQRKPHSEPADPMIDEADIGSGEKHPTQHETEDQIRQIPPLPDRRPDQAGGTGKTAPDGSPAGSGRAENEAARRTQQSGKTDPLSPER